MHYVNWTAGLIGIGILRRFRAGAGEMLGATKLIAIQRNVLKSFPILPSSLFWLWCCSRVCPLTVGHSTCLQQNRSNLSSVGLQS